MFLKDFFDKISDRWFQFDFEQHSSLEEVDRFIRVRFFQSVAILFTTYIALYLLRNTLRSDWLKVGINTLSLFYFSLILLYLKKKHDIDRAALISLPLQVFMELFIIYIIPSQDSGIVWLYALVLFMIYIGGTRFGFLASLISLLILLAAAALDQLSTTNTGYTKNAWVKIILVHLVMQFFSYLFSKRHKLLIQLFEKQYFSDSLTGLPNRACLVKDLQEHPDSTLVLLDIIGFSEINNFYGRSIGDELLKGCAKKLQEILEENPEHAKNWKLYKLSPDFFPLLSFQKIEKERVEKDLRMWMQVLQEAEFPCQDTLLKIRLKAGISNESKNKIETAEMALREANDKSYSSIFYSQSIDKSHYYKNNLISLDFIHEALVEDRVVAFFQPIFHNHTGKVHHAEALMRFYDKNGEAHTPFPYISVAKKANLYLLLSGIMLQKVSEFVQKYKIPCSINIADTDLHHINSFIEQIDHFFSEEDCALLDFELLEDSALKEGAAVQQLIDFSEKNGSKIAIDDFGAGYSNFRRLMDFGFDYLKIDGSLIREINQDSKSRTVVETILRYANTLGLEVVAEFVHSKEVADVVRNLGIHYSQGYYYGMPTPIDHFNKFI